jgi:hypothetical protein
VEWWTAADRTVAAWLPAGMGGLYRPYFHDTGRGIVVQSYQAVWPVTMTRLGGEALAPAWARGPRWGVAADLEELGVRAMRRCGGFAADGIAGAACAHSLSVNVMFPKKALTQGRVAVP